MKEGAQRRADADRVEHEYVAAIETFPVVETRLVDNQIDGVTGAERVDQRLIRTNDRTSKANA